MQQDPSLAQYSKRPPESVEKEDGPATEAY